MPRGVEGSVPGCAHPLCNDEASRWHREPGRKAAVGCCLAHHLEWRYNESKRRLREATKARKAERGGVRVYAGKALQPCGTPAAAKRHRERNEPVCEPCRKADNKRTAEWRAANRARRREVAQGAP